MPSTFLLKSLAAAGAAFPAAGSIIFDSFDNRTTFNPRSDGGNSSGADFLPADNVLRNATSSRAYYSSILTTTASNAFFQEALVKTIPAGSVIGFIVGDGILPQQSGVFVEISSAGTAVVFYNGNANDGVRILKGSNTTVIPAGTVIRVEHTTAGVVTIKNAVTGAVILTVSTSVTMGGTVGLYTNPNSQGAEFDSWSAGPL